MTHLELSTDRVVDFTPLKWGGSSCALPTFTSSFTGRDEELERLGTLLSGDAPSVTVVGPPGIGKTRLAAEFARNHLSGGGEVVYVGLFLVSGLLEVCHHIAAAFEVQVSGADSASVILEKICRRLSRREALLLVIDCCEHLVVEVSKVHTSIGSCAPSVHVLATSRERLGSVGEQILELEPLQLPEAGETDTDVIMGCDAVKFFLALAKGHGSENDLEEAEAEMVAELVRALDGNPLAIELCAARVPLLGLKEIKRSLNDRFSILKRKRRESGFGWSSLEEAIRWSWELLEDHERRGLMHLSVFRDGFTRGAAECVLGSYTQSSTTVVELLEALREKSLLKSFDSPNVSDERRFFLFENVREFALERLDEAGERAHLHEAYERYYLDQLGPSPDGRHIGGDEEVRERLRAERSNLLEIYGCAMRATPPRGGEALRAILALAPIYCTQGPFGPYLKMIEDAECITSACDEPVVSAAVMIAKGAIESRRGRYDEACRLFERALPELRRANATWVEAYVLIVLGGIFPFVYRNEEVKPVFKRAKKLVDKLDDDTLRAIFNKEVASFLMWRAPEEAESYLGKALLLFRMTMDKVRQAYTLTHLSACRYSCGKLDEAARTGQEALERLEALKDRRWAAQTSVILALIDFEHDRFEEAEKMLEKSLAVQRELGNPWLEAFTLLAVSEVRAERDDFDAARSGFLRVVEIARALDERMTTAWALSALGATAAWMGDFSDAENYLDEAQHLATTIGDDVLSGGIDVRRGVVEVAHFKIAADAGDNETATKWLDKARRRLARWEKQDPRIRNRAQLRIPLRALLRSVSRASALQDQGLRVGAGARWFCLGTGERVSLERRGRLRRVLLRLVEEREQRPGRSVPLFDLFGAGWPGEKASSDSMANRVYVTLTRLRGLGLGQAIKSDGDGFLIDPAVPVKLAPNP